jgi:hypothetical protein
MISIWFFVGIAMAVDGALILGAGIWQLLYPPDHPTVVLFSLHANVWWGALLLLFGAVYCLKFAPGRPRPPFISYSTW